MTNTHRNLQNLLFVAAATVSLAAISTPAGAGVDVQIGFGVPGIVVDARDPYYYSPSYCAGCWYGQWGGRNGYHRGGGRPWEREHFEADHHGHEHGRDVRHEGHR
jgi:predicted small secreted protein